MTPKDHLIVRPADLKDMLDKFKENEHRDDPYTCVILHLTGETYTWTMGVDKTEAKLVLSTTRWPRPFVDKHLDEP